MNSLFDTMPRIHISRFIGKTITPQVPILRKGPYYVRREKRWRCKHPPYTVGDGQVYILNGSEIICHPDDLIKIRQKLEEMGNERTRSRSH